MSIFFSKYKKLILTSILILLISSLGIFVLGVGESQAFWPFDKLKGIADLVANPYAFVTAIIAALGTAIQSIVSLFFWFGAMLFEIALSLGEFTEAGVVKMGWKITRDLANMFFVLILLVIAFATILRTETYGMKALLPKLIIAALLINFSLVLAGAVIDFSQVITYFFLEQMPGTSGISASIAKIINIQKAVEISKDADIAEKLAAGTAGIFMLIFSIILGIILILCAGLALIFGAFFLIVRLIILWFLLILAPLAWLLWILPATSHLFRQWWSTFLKWAFFAPIYVFFVYLAIKAAEDGAFASLIKPEIENILNQSGFKDTLLAALVAQPKLLLQFICIMGLLFGGLIVAQKMGVYGAQGAIGIVRGAGKGVAEWTGRRAQIKMAPKVKEYGERLQKTWVGRTPGLRQVVRPFRAFDEKERAAFAESEKKHDSRTSDNLMTGFEAANPRDKAAMGKVLAKRGHLKENKDLNFTDTSVKDALALAKRYEQHGDVLKARPDLAPLVGENIEKTVSKIKPADMEKLQTEALTGEAGEEVKKAIQNQLTNPNGQWKSSHLSKMNDVNPSVAVEIKQKIIDDPGRGPLRQDVEAYLESDAGKAIFGEPKPRAEKEAPFTHA